jgi:hemoglobin
MGPWMTTMRAAAARATTALLAALALTLWALAPASCGAKPPKVVTPEVALDAGAGDAAEAPPAPPSLYARLGGKDGIAGIIDAFMEDMAADKRIKKSFAKTKGPALDHFKAMLAEQLCEATGGGCKYSGKSMGDAHSGMKITGAQFDAFVSDFQLALEEKQVAKEDEQQVLDLLNMLKDQIVLTK